MLARPRVRGPDAVGLAAPLPGRAADRGGARPARQEPDGGPGRGSRRGPGASQRPARGPGCLHPRTLAARHAPRRADRRRDGTVPGRGRQGAYGRRDARRRQDRHAADDPQQAGPPDGRGVRRRQAPPGRWSRDGRLDRRRRRHGDGPSPPRAARRPRLPRRPGGRSDPGGRADHRGRGHVRCDHVEPLLSSRAQPQAGTRHPAQGVRRAAGRRRGERLPRLLLGAPVGRLVRAGDVDAAALLHLAQRSDPRPERQRSRRRGGAAVRAGQRGRPALRRTGER